MARYALHEIDDGMRPLTLTEEERLIQTLGKQLVFANLDDNIVKERLLFVPRPSMTARVLRGTFGIGGSGNGCWTEESFDRFFCENSAGGYFFWVEPGTFTGIFKPVSFAPYSAKRRDWWYMRALTDGMLNFGIVSADSRLSAFTVPDCRYTIVYGEAEIIAKFDELCGGKERLCADFAEYLTEKFVDLGEGNIYEFMRIHLPKIGGCE